MDVVPRRRTEREVRRKSYLKISGEWKDQTDVLDHPDVSDMTLGAVLAALADPSRRKVVTDLLSDPPGIERTCTSFGLPVTKSTRTHHFRVLREAGLIFDLDLGNRSSVSLRRDDLEARFPGLLDLLALEARP